MEVQKLDSAAILEWSYLGLGILGILWSYFGLYNLFLNIFSNSSALIAILGNNFVDTYFLAIGILSIVIVGSLHFYSKQSLTLGFIASLTIIGIAVASVIIPLLSFYSKTMPVDRAGWSLLFFIFYLPLFLPTTIFNLIGAFFIGRSLHYIMFLGKGAGRTTEY